MEDIEFDRFHSVEIVFNHGNRYKTMSRVDQKPTPREAWLVVDGHNGNAEAFWSDSYQLEKGLESAKDPERVRRGQLNTGGRDLKAKASLFLAPAKYEPGRAGTGPRGKIQWKLLDKPFS